MNSRRQVRSLEEAGEMGEVRSMLDEVPEKNPLQVDQWFLLPIFQEYILEEGAT